MLNNTIEQIDTTIYALVEQNDGSLKKINYEEYKQEKSCEMFYKLEYLQ